MTVGCRSDRIMMIEHNETNAPCISYSLRARRADQGRGEKSVVCNHNFEMGKKIRASMSGHLELLK